MSSIKNAPGDAVAEFFLSEIVPAGAALKARSGEVFPLGFDASAETYYTKREKTVAAKADFELPVNDLAGALEAMWQSQNRPELARLAPKIAQLARELRTEQDQEETVSPFIYVMF